MEWSHIDFVIESLVQLLCCDEFTCWTPVMFNIQMTEVYLSIKDARSTLCPRLLYCIVCNYMAVQDIEWTSHNFCKPKVNQDWQSSADTWTSGTEWVTEQSNSRQNSTNCGLGQMCPKIFKWQSIWMSCVLYKTEKRFIWKTNGITVLVTVWYQVVLQSWSGWWVLYKKLYWDWTYNRKFLP